ncbi:MAG: energy transducer TonB [Burkholderiales bacterium]
MASKLQPPAPVAILSPAPPVAAPVRPAAPVSAPAASAPVERELAVTYSKQISTQIKRFQKYPMVAQRRGWEGTAEVLVQIAADGRVTAVSLHRSSGRDILDEEALQMVRRAAPLPQAPQGLRGRKISITVPISFRLQES